MNTTKRSCCTLRAPAWASLFCGTLLLALLLAACSSVKTQVAKEPIKARTFSFFNPGPREVPNYADVRQQAHELVQQALVKNLSSKGITRVPSGGEVTVAYLIIAGNNGTTTSLNNYFGYTDEAVALVEKVHAEQTGSPNRNYFEAGTLVIDFVEPGTSRLLQRRSVHANVLRNLPLEARASRIQALVDQALADLPMRRSP